MFLAPCKESSAAGGIALTGNRWEGWPDKS